jgi:hypothetical protein
MRRFRTRRTRAGKGVWVLLAVLILGACVALSAGQAEAATVSARGMTNLLSGSGQPALTGQQVQPATPTPILKQTVQNQAGKPTNACTAGLGPAQINVCNQVQEVLVVGIFYPLWEASTSIVNQAIATLYRTDPKLTYLNPDIELLTGYTQDAIDLFLVLVVLVTGIRMVWEQSAFSWADFRETLPQVLMALVLSRISLNLAGAIIGLNNALISPFLSSFQSAFSGLVPPTLDLIDLPTTLLESFLGLMLVLLIVEAAVRIPVLGVLLILSPAGCFALAWKPTQRLGFLWLNAFLAAALVQFLQLLLLTAGLVVMKGLHPPQHVTYLSLIGGIALLFATLALPFAAYRWAIQPVASTAKATADSAIAAGRTIGTTAAGLL